VYANLDPDVKKDLRKMVFGQKTERRLWFRAHIIWYVCKLGWTVSETAVQLGTTTKTVLKWCRRFLDESIAGLDDRARSGRPPTLTVEQRCEVLAVACDDPGRYGFDWQSTWTLDTLTCAVNETVSDLTISRSSVWRTLKENKLQPHRMRMWLHSPDPHFREKVNTVVSLYHDPPPGAVVLCVDEKTGMQAIERKHATKRPIPGRPGRYEYEYIRHGTQSLIAAFDIQTGEVTARCGSRRRADDLLEFMEDVAERYAGYERIIIIWDNLNIHHDGPDKRWTYFNEWHGGKFTFVYTPLHASWVNQIEIFFSILHRRCLRHGNFTSQEDLREKVLAYIERWNTIDGHPFNWSFRGYPMQEKAVA
jgi:transposase